MALDALGSGIRLRAVTDSVARLVVTETVTGFLIRAAAGITQIYRIALNSFLSNSSKGRGCLGTLRSSEFGCRGMYLRQGSRLLIVIAAVLEFLKVSSKV
jgi:hypothetical protein